MNQESFTKARWGKAKSFKLSSVIGTPIRDSAIPEGGAGEGLTRKSLEKHFMGGADRKCGKSARWKGWLCLALAVIFFLAWQGCAGSIEALSLGDLCQEWRGPLVLYLTVSALSALEQLRKNFPSVWLLLGPNIAEIRLTDARHCLHSR